MNSGYNTPVFSPYLPALGMESLCQQSLYHQHTYVDRTRMAVTDVYVQEHVSQSSWTMSSPPVHLRTPVFIQSNRIAQSPAGRFAYMSMPGLQYYATSSASMNAMYGQTYLQQSLAAANMGGLYVPQYQPCYIPSKQQTKDNACQTHPVVKRGCDAGTQTDLIGDAPPMMNYNQQTTSSDSKESSTSKSFLDSFLAQVIHQGERRNSEVSLPKQRLKDFTSIALKGSDVAERLANAHRTRPCFKKMDTLCARLKQDLLRPDGVLPNINSQGIAWAVKDFIFVFTRIVNSWVILKGYVYNTPEGLNKIKDELPAGFMTTFDCWQLNTMTLVEMIIKSFVNLDVMLQKQKNSFSKTDMSNNNSNNNTWSSNGNSSDSNSSNWTLNGTDLYAPSTVSLMSPDNVHKPRAQSSPLMNLKIGTELNCITEPLEPKTLTPCSPDLNYLYTMIQDSEEAQRCVNANGTYLKTGTYTPLRKDDPQVEQLLATPPPKSITNTWMAYTHQSTNCITSIPQISNTPSQPLPLSPPSPPSFSLSPSVSPSSTPPSLPPFEQHNNMFKSQTPHLITSQYPHSDLRPHAIPFYLVGREMAHKLYELSSHIMQMKNIDRFFQKLFTRNYYPYFYERYQHEFIDVRAIILKCESATYPNIYQAIHDMRRIIYLVRMDLKHHTNMDLRLYTALYERDVNEMICKPPYQPQQFDHITGQPGEQLFYNNI